MTLKAANPATVPCRSPFRYPGGKTWLIPTVRRWLKHRASPMHFLVEPFLGGGIVSLTAVFENLVGIAVMSELDDDVAAVWQVMLDGRGGRLARRVGVFELTPQSLAHAIGRAHYSLPERAFATLLRNRVNRGGILAPGAGKMRDGEAGRGVASRWYSKTLAERILAVDKMRDAFVFQHTDGFNTLQHFSPDPDAVYFVDPPYPKIGGRLYAHSDMDHTALFAVMSRVAGDFLMTYSRSLEILALVSQYKFDVREITMKTTRHKQKQELLIGRDLSWFDLDHSGA